MTPERLQQMKERYADEMIRREHVAELIDTVDHLTAENATARTAWDEWKTSSRAGHAHASDMADENARLRKGISRLHANVERWHANLPRDTADSLIRSELADLLNPPTEGETDDLRTV